MENKKNIIMIIVDALRPRNLSLFGYEKETDKNLKRIAKESILFRKHFSTSNSTAPALTSIFTGLYPKTHGILHQFPYTKEGEMKKFEEVKFWLPSFLKEEGYETIAIDWIGMWFKRGFSYYEEKEEKQSYLKKFMNIPLIKKILLNLPSWAYKLGKKVIKTRASVEFTPSDETVELAIKKIKTAGKPFFLFMHFWDTHFPFPTTKKPKDTGKIKKEDILNKIKAKSQKEYIKKRFEDIGLEYFEAIKDKYDEAIKNIDRAVGKLYDFLKKDGLWQDSIFIFLGDHGTSLGEHNVYFSHSGLYDVSIHVPLIIHLPGIEAKEINKLVQNIDIAPTILDYLNFKINEKFDGKSLMPLIKEDKEIRDKVLLVDGLSHNIKGIRTENRKLIVAEDTTCNLCKASHHKAIEEYDLENDGEEEKNIYSGKSELMRLLI